MAALGAQSVNFPASTIVLFLTLSLVIQAEARLGWTVLEAQQNYRTSSVLGKQGRAFSDSSIEIILEHEGWKIHMAWFPGNSHAQYIQYTPASGPISEAQLEAILQANSDGKKWVFRTDSNSEIGVAFGSLVGLDLRNGYFEREDSAQTSHVAMLSLLRLSIRSAWLIEKERQEKEAKEKLKKNVPAF